MDSPGLRRPRRMDDEDWAEYRFSEEARVELMHVPGEPGLDPYDDYDRDYPEEHCECVWCEREFLSYDPSRDLCADCAELRPGDPGFGGRRIKYREDNDS